MVTKDNSGHFFAFCELWCVSNLFCFGDVASGTTLVVRPFGGIVTKTNQSHALVESAFRLVLVNLGCEFGNDLVLGSIATELVNIIVGLGSMGLHVGNVTATLGSNVTAEGPAVVSEPASGVANFNAWVLCAGSC